VLDETTQDITSTIQDRTIHDKLLRYWQLFVLYDVWWTKYYFGIF